MMRASQANKQEPMPLPLPLPPLSLPSTPSTVPRRRSRTASSSSSSSSVSTVFSPSSSPAPSPRSTTTATSVVPFSWERRPGLPKSSLAGLISSSGSSCSTTLPLPPPPLRHSPRRCRQRRRRRAVETPAPAADPFAAAFMECTREEGMDDDDDADDKLWPVPTVTVSGRTARPWRLAGGGVVGLLDLYRCRSAMDVVDGAFLARRPVAPPPRPGPCRATRR